MRLNNKVAIITGGSRGIGAACVRKFAAAGDRVIFLYRSSEEAAAKLAHETGAMGLKCDVADKKAVEALFSHFSVSVDVLINNAGIYTCWINRTGEKRPDNLRIDLEIEDFVALEKEL